MTIIKTRPKLQTIKALLVGAVLLCLLGSGGASAHSLLTSIYAIQYSELPGGESPYADELVTVEGEVTAIFQNGFTLAEAAGPWQAIFIYTYTCGPQIGDHLRVTGQVAEYNGMTEIQALTLCESGPRSGGPTRRGDPAHRQALPVPVSAVAQEQYESVLVQIADVSVVRLADYGEWEVSNNTGALLRVDDLNDYAYFPALDDRFDTLVGVLFYSFGEFKLEPRHTGDLHGPAIPHYFLHGDVITMDENRSILPEAYLEIEGDRILSISQQVPGSGAVIDTGGLIFPGLIDAHNHPYYNAFGKLPFTQLYADRYEWQADPLYLEFKEQYNAVRNYGGSSALADDIFRLAELRSLSAGTTTIQGCNCNGHEYDDIAHQGIGANNCERFPQRTLGETFPLEESAAEWLYRQGQYWERFVIHLSEGTNPGSLEEFYDWRGMGMLDERTVIIHGLPYGSSEWLQMAATGAHLIWSPMSNWYLYGATAQVPAAYASGVNVALAPDWTATGMENLLTELRFADLYDNSMWNDRLSAQTLVEMVTRNAALALGMEAEAGQISPGYRADLMVVPGSTADPYAALLQATPGEVRLSVVSGRPMYGEADILAQFEFLEQFDTVNICGKQKVFATRIDAHAIPEASLPVGSTLLAIETAYEAASPKIAPLLLLEDTSAPDLVLLARPVPNIGGAGEAGMLIQLGAFDNCASVEPHISGLQLLDSNGVEIDPSGYLEIRDTQIYAFTGCTDWEIQVTLSASDLSGNSAERTFSQRLANCGVYLPMVTR